MESKILIVDDNKSVLTALEMLLQTKYREVFVLSNSNNLISSIRQHQIDIVLLDMNFKAGLNTGNEGIFWLNEIKKLDDTISVIMITAFGDIELAVKAVRDGAFDFILKPWDNNKLLSTVSAAAKLRKSKAENLKLREKTNTLQNIIVPEYKIIGKSKAITTLMKIVQKVAQTDANILITGENGTGKQLIAQEIHRYSKRKNEIFLNVDMGSLSETLFESELFGHVKGAFTDAKEDRTGKFELADKGTLFLDEIANLSLSLQAKILSALQNRCITPLGGNKQIPVDIRLVSATNRDISKMIEEGSFREDLFYRINTISIEIPPLRERDNDIILLAEYYLHQYVEKYQKKALKISNKAKHKLLNYQWPGNVRELQHCIEKAVILAENHILDENSFSLNQQIAVKQNNLDNLTLEEMEKNMILVNIDKEKGNMSAVAKNLGITRQTLYNKLKKYGL
ncbi:MAG: sigma-54 dependent transcriptional regulator [Bacteroidales bacterium]|nr:sigma-54 dependent transcriptional regulator [Bacteroidales bacterium]